MAYKALYRSYRPTSFSEVVGQKHVIQTLKNAVVGDRTSHAYVFCGLRGIGKTTIARILAKAVNCEHPVEGEPCNECANCRAINNNETTDIVELDAASNNGVDEIRNILDKVNFLPSVLKKKVYIIDEVHMLSTAAFNALLKTLEEPPAYVVFILATTEPHKIPLTILSRCQRFDFKQLTNEELIKELTYVCEKEQIKITKEALDGIATAAEGGMRDALSILDQANVYADEEVTIDDVNSITGNISNSLLIELVKSFNCDNASKAIKIVNDLLNMGKEVSRLTVGVIQFCRDVLLYKSINSSELSKNIYNNEEFIKLANETDNARLFYYIDVLVDVQNKIRFTNSQKIYLEVGIMKIVNQASEDIDVLGRLQAIEQRLAGDATIEISPSYTQSPSVDNRIQALESKLKRINNDFEKLFLVRFEEKVQSRLNVLEDVTSRVSVLPDALDQRVQALERVISSNSLVEEKVGNLASSSESVDTDKINQLEQTIKDNTIKYDQILTGLTSEIENIKNSPKELGDQATSDEVILELIEKVTTIETKLEEPKTSFLESSTHQSLDLRAIESRLDTLEQKINVSNNQDLTTIIKEIDNIKNSLQYKGEPVQPTLFDFQEDESNVQIQSILSRLKELEETLANSLLNKEEELKGVKQEIEGLKLNSISTSIDFESEELKSKVNELEFKLNNIQKEIVNVPQQSSSCEQAIDEIKTNYFVLTKALKYLTDKVDAPKELNLDEYNNRLSTIEHNVADLESKVNNMLKEGSIKEVIVEPIKKEVTTMSKPEQKDPVSEAGNDEVLAKETVTLKDENKEETKTLTEVNDSDITDQVYDIKIVENLLHQARSREGRAAKNDLLEGWRHLEDKVGDVLAPIARHLGCGMLVANGFEHLLIVFPSAELCNVIMEPKAHKDALAVIKAAFNKNYDFIALPEDTWREKRLEYQDQIRIGISLPKLKPIRNPLLKVVLVERESQLTERQKKLQKANEFFGN